MSFDRRVPYIILLLGAVWVTLTATGVLRSWLVRIARLVPQPILFALVISALAMVLLSAIASTPRLNLAASFALLIGVSVLPLLFRIHPAITLILLAFLYLEAYLVVPRVSRSRRNRAKPC